MQCHICYVFAESAGSLQEGLVGLEAVRTLWLDEFEITHLDFMDRIARLMFIYILCLTVMTNLDRIFRSPAMLQLYDGFIAKFDGRADFDLIQAVLWNW